MKIQKLPIIILLVFTIFIVLSGENSFARSLSEIDSEISSLMDEKKSLKDDAEYFYNNIYKDRDSIFKLWKLEKIKDSVEKICEKIEILKNEFIKEREIINSNNKSLEIEAPKEEIISGINSSMGTEIGYSQAVKHEKKHLKIHRKHRASKIIRKPVFVAQKNVPVVAIKPVLREKFITRQYFKISKYIKNINFHDLWKFINENTLIYVGYIIAGYLYIIGIFILISICPLICTLICNFFEKSKKYLMKKYKKYFIRKGKTKYGDSINGQVPADLI